MERVISATRVEFPVVEYDHGTYLAVGTLWKGGRPRDIYLPMNTKVQGVRDEDMENPAFWTRDYAYDVTQEYPMTEAGQIPVLFMMRE
jgi:hypothetical protein